jgi:hypothetical protein
MATGNGNTKELTITLVNRSGATIHRQVCPDGAAAAREAAACILLRTELQAGDMLTVRHAMKGDAHQPRDTD